MARPLKFVLITALIAFNLTAVIQGGSQYFVTFANLPARDVSLGDGSPETIARLLGDARHKGGEGMRNYLLPSLYWFLTAIAVDSILLISMISRYPSRRRD